MSVWCHNVWYRHDVEGMLTSVVDRVLLLGVEQVMLTVQCPFV